MAKRADYAEFEQAVEDFRLREFPEAVGDLAERVTHTFDIALNVIGNLAGENVDLRLRVERLEREVRDGRH